MLFGLTNAPVAFMDVINRVLKKYLDSFLIAFIDDILNYSFNEHDLMKHFWPSPVSFLGNVLCRKGIDVDPKRADAVKSHLRPLTLIDIIFIGV